MRQNRRSRPHQTGMEIHRKITALFAATSILPVLLLIYVSIVYVAPHTHPGAAFLALLVACVLLCLAGSWLVMRMARRLGEISRSLSGAASGVTSGGGDGLAKLSSAAKLMKGKVEQQRSEIWQLKQQQSVLKLEIHKARGELDKADSAEVVPGTWDIEGWREYLAQEVERSKRYHKRFCVLCAKIPNYESRMGTIPKSEHDEVSRVVTDKMRSLVRNSDLVAGSAQKYFGIMLPETDGEGGRQVGSRLAILFPEHAFVARGALQGLSFPLCVGIATYPFDARDPKTLLERARTSLSFAVRRGGGSVAVYDRHTME